MLTFARRLVLSSMAISGLLLAQDAAARFNRAPAGVEEALRARMKQFYELQMEGKFRQAESCVCEESKDRYYDSEKQRWRGFDVLKINWEKDYSQAVVVIEVSADISTRFGRMASKVPLTSMWHYEGGNWCFYMKPREAGPVATPFGISVPNSSGQAAGAAPVPQRVTVADVASAVKVSKKQVNLKADQDSSDQIEITNGLPGVVRLEVKMPEIPGLQWEAPDKEIRSGATVAVRLAYSPPAKGPKQAFEFRLSLEPIGQSVPIQVVFDRQ